MDGNVVNFKLLLFFSLYIYSSFPAYQEMSYKRNFERRLGRGWGVGRVGCTKFALTWTKFYLISFEEYFGNGDPATAGRPLLREIPNAPLATTRWYPRGTQKLVSGVVKSAKSWPN